MSERGSSSERVMCMLPNEFDGFLSKLCGQGADGNQVDAVVAAEGEVPQAFDHGEERWLASARFDDPFAQRQQVGRALFGLSIRRFAENLLVILRIVYPTFCGRFCRRYAILLVHRFAGTLPNAYRAVFRARTTSTAGISRLVLWHASLSPSTTNPARRQVPKISCRER